MIRGYDYWAKLIREASQSLTADQLDRATQCAVEIEERGEQPSAWHCVAVACGFLSVCPCFPCEAKRKAVEA